MKLLSLVSFICICFNCSAFGIIDNVPHSKLSVSRRSNDQQVIIETGKHNKTKIKTKNKARTKASLEEEVEKHSNCYKTFYWCRGQARDVKAKLKCFRPFRVCVEYNCKEATSCNANELTCDEYSTNNKEILKCYSDIWLHCIRQRCPMNM
ncbi:uncharacterized protein LOC130623890 [Hydractinia symbiolongicarpus]|uniref:uncharacterized protein LOC130623890 n=1 Tax=Hydractinia symbiolongicarpus TaxID=13093 RepID=UPI002550BB5F|nr:uncharacterized protein LOC130623890 [Hydractinia symbiolongicarpus]